MATLERITTGVVSLAALVLVGLAIRREIRPVTSAGAGQDQNAPPVYVPEWRRMTAAGHWVGDSNATVTIVEFADFECPFCRQFHEAFVRAKAVVGHDVALVYIHFPIGGHRFAVPAARAAECAAQQGMFGPFHDALYARQDSLGLKMWSAYAAEAHLPDTAAFARCSQRSDEVASVSRGKAVGDSLGVRGTPTVLINGWRYAIAPYDSLTQIIQRAVKLNAAR